MKYNERTKQYLIEKFEEVKEERSTLIIEYVIISEYSLLEYGNNGVELETRTFEHDEEERFKGLLEIFDFYRNEDPEQGDYVYYFISSVEIVDVEEED